MYVLKCHTHTHTRECKKWSESIYAHLKLCYSRLLLTVYAVAYHERKAIYNLQNMFDQSSDTFNIPSDVVEGRIKQIENNLVQ